MKRNRPMLLALCLMAACKRDNAPRVGLDASIATDRLVGFKDSPPDSMSDLDAARDASGQDAMDGDVAKAHEDVEIDVPDDRPIRRHEDPPPWFGGSMSLPPPRMLPVADSRHGCFGATPSVPVGFDSGSQSGCVLGDWIYVAAFGDVGRAPLAGSHPQLIFAGDEGMYAGMLAHVACGGSSFFLAIADIYSWSIAIVEFEDPSRPGILRWEQRLGMPSPERTFGGFASVTASDAMIAWVWGETGGPSHLYVSGPHGENPRDLRVPYIRPPHNLQAWHDRLVFVSGGDIWLWTVGSAEPENLTNDDPDQWYPWIEGDRIVWVDQRDNPVGDLWSPDNPEIYSFDLRTRTRTRITHDTVRPAVQHAPTLSGDWAVWMDFRNAVMPNPSGYITDTMEIWGYNFRTGREYRVQQSGRSAYPLVNGDRLYFNCLSGVSQLVTRTMPRAE